MKEWNHSRAILTAATVPFALLVGWIVYRKSRSNAQPERKILNEQISYSEDVSDVEEKSFKCDLNSKKKIKNESNSSAIHPSSDDLQTVSTSSSVNQTSLNVSRNPVDNEDDYYTNLVNHDVSSIDKTCEESLICDTEPNKESPCKNSEDIASLESFECIGDADFESSKPSKDGLNEKLKNDAFIQHEINGITKEISSVVQSVISKKKSSDAINKSACNASDGVESFDIPSSVNPSLENGLSTATDYSDDSGLIVSNDSLTEKPVPIKQCDNESSDGNIELEREPNVNNNNNLIEHDEKLTNGQVFSSDSSSYDNQQNSDASQKETLQNGWDSSYLNHSKEKRKEQRSPDNERSDSVSKSSCITDSDDGKLQVYSEFPSDKVGLLIGKQGRNIKQLKQDSGADVYVHTAKSRDDIQVLEICGTQAEVESCVSRIKRRFNDITLSPFDPADICFSNNSRSRSPPTTTPSPVLYPMPSQLRLPDGMVDVLVTAVAAVDCVFLQYYSHPSFHALVNLEQAMLMCYSEPVTPGLAKPVQAGLICAAYYRGIWYRAQVVKVFKETDEIAVKLMDHGGYVVVAEPCVKQIRADFVTLPFQAIECYLDGIEPTEEECSQEARAEGAVKVGDLLKGGRYQARVTGVTTDGHPKIHLYKCVKNEVTFVNEEIAKKGLATWLEPAPLQ